MPGAVRLVNIQSRKDQSHRIRGGVLSVCGFRSFLIDFLVSPVCQ